MKLINKTQNSSIFLYKNQDKVKDDARVIKRIHKYNKENAFTEIACLKKLQNSPYIIHLDFVYQNEKSFYMVMDYAIHGCLYDVYALLHQEKLKRVVKSFLLCIFDCHKHMCLNTITLLYY